MPGCMIFAIYTRRPCWLACLCAWSPPRLGYADPSITLRVYAHVISDHLTEAADIFARAVAATS
jgi:hypothetical protein